MWGSDNSTATRDILDGMAAASARHPEPVPTPNAAASTSPMIGHNGYSPELIDFFSAMRSLADLPSDHDLFLDKRVVDRAVNLVSSLYHTYQIDLPKILPEDRDTVSLTWDDGVIKRFLSVDHSDLDFLVYSRVHNISCDEVLGENGAVFWRKLVEGFSAFESKRSSVR